MTRDEILAKVKDIVADTIDGADASKITEATTFENLGADSFDRLELVTAFEEEFDATLPDEVLASIDSVKDAVDAIEKVL